MESIKELRQMLQTNVLGHPVLQRALSIYITRPLLYTPVTPNQVTVFTLLLGVAGGTALFLGYFWLGVVLAYLNVLFDAVDGEIARYKKIYSLRGIYLDLVNHLLSLSLFFLGMTFFVSGLPQNASILVLVVGMLGALAMSLRRANADLSRVLFVRQYLEHPDLFAMRHDADPGKEPTTSERISSVSVVRRILRVFYEMHGLAPIIIIFTLLYVVELAIFSGVPGHPILARLVIFYGATSCLYLMREIIGSFCAIEERVRSIAHKFSSKHQQ